MKVTETESHYNHLEKMSVRDLLVNINREDKKVSEAVKKVIPKAEKLVEEIIKRMEKGGRLFYLGAGTSGRLGIVDASECPPTFGVPQGLVIGLIAGGDKAIRKAVEFAEDNSEDGWNDLKKYKVNKKDVVIGIAASGTTPYVIGAIKKCREKKILTGAITCNHDSPLAKAAQYPIEVIVGPEFVTGSTRMKAGTAQKLVLNLISTTVMIKLGRVLGNRMVDMQLTNNKLIKRGTNMLMKSLKLNERDANKMLLKYGSVRKALAANSNS
ncbi:MAG TPA: N-acetylmuramic acid 6-phosphate etherase [Bacteroidia bacterium]|nr:N-acetylmuramic acid 6-phosphate etherase [Bacteroidia bacterium]